MKGIRILVVGMIMGGAVMSAEAAYIGSPVNVPLDIMEERRVVIAGEGNFVSQRDLDPIAGIKSSIDESVQIGLRAEYGIAEGVSIFMKTGMADWKFQSPGVTIQYDSAAYFGGGLKYLYQSEANLLLGGDIQYVFQPRAKADSVTNDNVAATSITGLDVDVSDLQISVLLGYRVVLQEDTSLVPYAGLAYSQFRFNIDRGTFTAGGTTSRAAQGYAGDNAMSVVIGTSLQTGPAINMNIEMRFLAERALSIGVNYRF